MECNKDDAIRAKALAEKKLLEKDIAGAKKFAWKAHNLFPGLEGLSQFQEILDVYVASESKVNGEVDWYGIIGVDPLANDEAIRNGYKKLALSLHPDRNKCVGADGAFKLLSEAWSFLSDKAKKSAYDRKVTHGKFVVSNPRAGVMKNGSKKPRMSSLNSNSKYPATHGNMERDSGFHQSNQRTFWTACRKCNVQYEYLIVYLNQNLICPNCKLPFLAIEKPPPVSTNIGNSSNDWPYGSNKRFKTSSYVKRKFTSSTAGGAKNYSQNVNRVHVNDQNSRKDILNNKRQLNGQSLISRSITGGAISRSKGNDFRPPGMHNILMGMARVKILTKLNEWNIRGRTITGENQSMEEEDTEESISGPTKKIRNMTGSLGDDRLVQSRTSSVSLLKNEELSENVPALDHPNEIITTIVPEFYDFDKDLSDESFGENQVWAIYDAKDGMPRYYALIRGSISKDPIEVQISWLNFESDCDLTWVKWFNCGFQRTCGDFRVGKCEVVKNHISFSHRVKYSKDCKGLIRIYPNKGDVWILYRNWCSDWNELTPDDVIRQYDLVEVLEDYNNEHGVLVVPLLKVASFKAVFHPNLDPKTIYIIPKDELFRFSHQVPSHVLTNENAKWYLKGCRELDPAALPIEFLQVTRKEEEAEEEEDVDTPLEDEDIIMVDEVSEHNGTNDDADCVAIETSGS